MTERPPPATAPPPAVTNPPPAAVADDRVCDVCDERPARQVLKLDTRLVAACSRCAADLRRDGIDLEDDEGER